MRCYSMLLSGPQKRTSHVAFRMNLSRYPAASAATWRRVRCPSCPNQQLQIAERAVVGGHADVVWISRQHGLLVRPARPSDSDGRFDLIFRDGELWAVVGTTHSR
jgi:hypothetical protein